MVPLMMIADDAGNEGGYEGGLGGAPPGEPEDPEKPEEPEDGCPEGCEHDCCGPAGGNPESCDIEGCNHESCGLEGGNTGSCDIEGCDHDSCGHEDGNTGSCDIEGCDHEGCGLEGGNTEGCDIEGCDHEYCGLGACADEDCGLEDCAQCEARGQTPASLTGPLTTATRLASEPPTAPYYYVATRVNFAGGGGASENIAISYWIRLGVRRTADSIEEYYLQTYCLDLETEFRSAHYLFPGEPKNVSPGVRGVLNNSYPVLSLEQVRFLWNLPNLSEEDAYRATQYAIWQHTNGDM